MLLRVPGLPEIRTGDDLSREIEKAAKKAKLELENGDVLVVAQKIV